MKYIYTIGYSCFKIHDFIKILKNYTINSVIDVRSNPHSKFYTDYNKEYLMPLLKRNNIVYRNYSKEFGARQEEKKYFTDGYLDFDKFTKSDIFDSGIKKIENGMKLNYTFVLMCAEKDPATCHRNIMVAKEFYRLGYPIYNILENGTVETQESVEKRLVDYYFPNRNQISLFDDELKIDEMINQSYRFRNKDIAFKFDDNKEKGYSYE